MKRIPLMRFFLIALPALLVWGCYPEGPEYTEDLDVVYTTFDKAYNFQAPGNGDAVYTYSMPDSIVVDADKENGVWVPEYMPQGFADQILGQIEINMTANGWTRLANNPDGSANAAADVILTPAAIKSTTYFYTYWYDWYYGGWGWYYPPYYTVSSYTTGSMVMVIGDPNVASPINQSQAAWVAVGNGLFSGAYDLNRVKRSIDQAFDQSPYLKVN